MASRFVETAGKDDPDVAGRLLVEDAFLPTLSPREQEIARLVAIGYPNKTIAGILDISPWTVATHVRRIFAKLNVHGRPAMIAELAQAGFRFDRRRPHYGGRGNRV
ncbi:MAG TPA: helix-turn-helix transcriptional regulator [Allosphingosinicella sp.]|nr:helix-turn-helix transcriptional regulator [Allosphingosinicella sp.]